MSKKKVTEEQMKPLKHSFKNCNFFIESVEPLSRNRHQNMTQNEHVYAIWCRPEVAGDVIYGEKCKECRGLYALLHFEAATISTFTENQNQPFAYCIVY